MPLRGVSDWAGLRLLTPRFPYRRGAARLKTWVQLTGVFYATHGQLLLYVNYGDGKTAGNGLPAGSTPDTSRHGPRRPSGRFGSAARSRTA
jgi:hypothetical protein